MSNFSGPGGIELTDISQLKCVSENSKPEKKEKQDPKNRSLLKDIQDAIARANVLGAYGVQVNGLEFTKDGIELHCRGLYEEKFLDQSREQVRQQMDVHKSRLITKTIMERAVNEEEFADPEKAKPHFARIAEEYIKTGKII